MRGAGLRRSMKRWQNKIIGYDEVEPDQLLANPHNHRIHPQKQQDWLQASLDQLGWIGPILVNRQTGNVLDGHARIVLAMRHNQGKVPVAYVDLSEDEEKRAIAVYDRITSMAFEDPAILTDLFNDIVIEDDEALAGILKQIASEVDTPKGLNDQLPGEKKQIGAVCPQCGATFSVEA